MEAERYLERGYLWFVRDADTRIVRAQNTVRAAVRNSQKAGEETGFGSVS